MNRKTSKLFTKVSLAAMEKVIDPATGEWGGFVKNHLPVSELQRIWRALPHRQRGKMRVHLERELEFNAWRVGGIPG